MVLRTRTGEGTTHYVVLDGKVAAGLRVHRLAADQLPADRRLDLNSEARAVGLQDFVPDPAAFTRPGRTLAHAAGRPGEHHRGGSGARRHRLQRAAQGRRQRPHHAQHLGGHRVPRLRRRRRHQHLRHPRKRPPLHPGTGQADPPRRLTLPGDRHRTAVRRSGQRRQRRQATPTSAPASSRTGRTAGPSPARRRSGSDTRRWRPLSSRSPGPSSCPRARDSTPTARASPRARDRGIAQGS